MDAVRRHDTPSAAIAHITADRQRSLADHSARGLAAPHVRCRHSATGVLCSERTSMLCHCACTRLNLIVGRSLTAIAALPLRPF